ncbi:hypothetical protein N8D56_25000 (plasmid) [Devosia sp. A8/3-2]|nr:hypothetical protein N8D56_25000 [Devosia sp. A8/3-2]
MVLLALSTAAASAAEPQLIEFFAKQGCAIGPTTRSLATAEGFDQASIDALIETARANPDSIETGGWLVMSSALCKIRPPQVRSELRLSDLEIQSRITAIDEHKDEPGCFLHADKLYEELLATRGWSPDKAHSEYLRFLAENLVSGALTFYSRDPLGTPVGLQLTSGDCANVPEMVEIRRSHESLIDNFDQLIRIDMANGICESDGAPSWKAPQLYEEIETFDSSNARTSTEVRFIAMGAGWIEGITMSDNGIPRPPLCVFKQEEREGQWQI